MKNIYEMTVILAGTVFIYLLILSPYIIFQPTAAGSMSLLHTSNLVLPLISLLIFCLFYTLIGMILLRNQN